MYKSLQVTNSTTEHNYDEIRSKNLSSLWGPDNSRGFKIISPYTKGRKQVKLPSVRTSCNYGLVASQENKVRIQRERSSMANVSIDQSITQPVGRNALNTAATQEYSLQITEDISTHSNMRYPPIIQKDEEC